jgi:hypothetical protein
MMIAMAHSASAATGAEAFGIMNRAVDAINAIKPNELVDIQAEETRARLDEAARLAELQRAQAPIGELVA